MSFAQNFVQAFQQGSEIRRRKEQDEKDEEERKLRIDALKHQQKEIELEGRYKALERSRAGVKEAAGAMEGQPLEKLIESMVYGQMQPGQGGELGARPVPLPAGPMTPQQMPGGGNNAVTPGDPSALSRKTFNVPGSQEFNIPGYSLTPKSEEENVAATVSALLQKAQTEAMGHKYAPGEVSPVLGPEPPAGPRQESAGSRPSMEHLWLEAKERGDTAAMQNIERAMNLRDQNMGGNGGEGAAKRSRLVNAVLANPQLWDDLPASERGDIAADLAQAGFAGFGRRMSDASIARLAESRAAIEGLRDLRTTLQENEQYIGPLAGLQSMNPYSEGRKAQAKIDLVRQRVGKALEGGVLRKEDEEKYKKILATLRDEPTTAIYKVDNLIQTLERDIELFVEEQKNAGRRTPAAKAGTTKIGRFEVETVP